MCCRFASLLLIPLVFSVVSISIFLSLLYRDAIPDAIQCTEIILFYFFFVVVSSHNIHTFNNNTSIKQQFNELLASRMLVIDGDAVFRFYYY